jgi:hypothetical protein
MRLKIALTIAVFLVATQAFLAFVRYRDREKLMDDLAGVHARKEAAYAADHDARRAAYHAAMKRKYQSGRWWIPDPPEPKP